MNIHSSELMGSQINNYIRKSNLVIKQTDSPVIAANVDDNVSISNEAKQQQNKEKIMKIVQKQRDELNEMMKRLNKSDTEEEDEWEIKRKCLIISLRIMNGDRVPSKDIAYLAEHEPQMYAQAIMLKLSNDDPKKYKSILEDNNNKQDPTESLATAQEGNISSNDNVISGSSDITVET